MQDGAQARRRVLVTTTRGGDGSPPAGEALAYASLGGVVARPQDEPAPPLAEAAQEPVAVHGAPEAAP